MKKFIIPVCSLGLLLTLVSVDAVGQRRGGGGGGGRGGFAGGGARPAGGGGFKAGGSVGARPGGVVQSYGGGSIGSRASTPIVGPGGGVGQAGKAGGSITTKGGSNIQYGGAGIGGTTPGGIQGGKYVGGIQVTTPGGKEVGKIGTGGAAVGPGGKAIGGKQSIAGGTGPQGSFTTKSKSGAAIGPQGGVAGKATVGKSVGPGGTHVGGGAYGGAANPYGAVAGRAGFVAGQGGTYYRSAAAIRGQGVYVRQGVVNYPCFRPGWYVQYPGAWLAAGWAAGYAWRAPTWVACSGFCGYPAAPIYYDYGTTVVYQDNGVYIDGTRTASAEEYAQQATTLAESGREAKSNKDDEWLPLGVFAMVQGEEKTSNHIFQLAVNKQNVIRGNYYDAVTDSTALVYGTVDPKTQRAAWTVGDRKTPVFEAGIANLTKEETTLLVHYGKDRTQQSTLIRIEDPEKTNPEKAK